jgi:hypothetical protein
MAEPINVIIEDDDDSVRTDPRTGAVEVNQPDGGVVVYLHGLPKEKADKDEQEDWFKNLADEMSAQELAVIANELHEAILADDNHRKHHWTITSVALTSLAWSSKSRGHRSMMARLALALPTSPTRFCWRQCSSQAPMRRLNSARQWSGQDQGRWRRQSSC